MIIYIFIVLSFYCFYWFTQPLKKKFILENYCEIPLQKRGNFMISVSEINNDKIAFGGASSILFFSNTNTKDLVTVLNVPGMDKHRIQSGISENGIIFSFAPSPQSGSNSRKFQLVMKSI